MKYTLTINIETKHKLEKLINDFKNIDIKKDLSKRNLSLNDYHIIESILIDLFEKRQSSFIQENVKNYLENFGIICAIEGIGWNIKL